MHRRIVIVACVLALIQALAYVAADTITSCTTRKGETYDGNTLDMRAAAQSTAGVLACSIIGATVVNEGLVITSAGATERVMSAAVQLRMLYTTVNDATIAITGPIPANAQLRFTNTTADMRSGRSVFDLTNMQLLDNATLTIANTTATWASEANAGSVVQLSATNAPMAADSGIFVIYAAATRAASVVATTTSPYVVADRAVLAVDYSTCIDCSGALVDLKDKINIRDNSMLRITHSLTNRNALLSTPKYHFGKGGLLLISDSQATTAAPLSIKIVTTFDTGATIMLYNLTSSHVPRISTGLGSVTLVVGQWHINGKHPKRVYEHLRSYSPLLLSHDMRNKRLCSYQQCIKANIKPTQTSLTCACTCKTGTHAPFCTTMVDPLAAILAERNSNCHVRNCKTCVTDKSLLCSACDDGYTLRADGTCAQAST